MPREKRKDLTGRPQQKAYKRVSPRGLGEEGHFVIRLMVLCMMLGFRSACLHWGFSVSGTADERSRAHE